MERLRVEAARRALAEAAQPVKRIARTCGFGSEETMRRSFRGTSRRRRRNTGARFGG
ncbi:helix-turn-helix domain-containing protein [Methylobacterium oryzae CBMB20]